MAYKPKNSQKAPKLLKLLWVRKQNVFKIHFYISLIGFELHFVPNNNGDKMNFSRIFLTTRIDTVVKYMQILLLLIFLFKAFKKYFSQNLGAYNTYSTIFFHGPYYTFSIMIIFAKKKCKTPIYQKVMQ